MSDNKPETRIDFKGAVQPTTARAIQRTVQALQGLGLDINPETLSNALAKSPMAEQIEGLAWELKLAEDKTLKDPLTGAYNRAGFNERLQSALDRLERDGGYVMVAISDIDNFKTINDTYGHPFGDEVIKTVVNRLTSAVRKVDTVARIGGEEIAVIIEAKNSKVLETLQQRLGQEICGFDFEHKATQLRIGNSVGVAVANVSCAPVALYERADLALYQAKNTGKGRLLVDHSDDRPSSDPRPGCDQ